MAKKLENPLPTFLVIGAMKSATTSLHYYLSRHPEILMSSVKELNFFTKHWRYGTWWYRHHFRRTTNRCIGESTTYYSRLHLYPKVPERIFEVLPDCKFIYMVRDPLERSFSHYFYDLLQFSSKNKGLPEAIIKDGSDFILSSDYFYQLSGFTKYFEKDRFLIVKSEGFQKNVKKTMSGIFDFLDVDANFYHPDFGIVHNKHTDLPTLNIPLKVTSWKTVKTLLDRGYLLPSSHIEELTKILKKRNARFHSEFQINDSGWYKPDKFRQFEKKFLASLGKTLS